MAAAGGHWVKGSFKEAAGGASAGAGDTIPNDEMGMATDSLIARLRAEGYEVTKKGAGRVQYKPQRGRPANLAIGRDASITYGGGDTKLRQILTDWTRIIGNAAMEQGVKAQRTFIGAGG